MAQSIDPNAADHVPDDLDGIPDLSVEQERISASTYTGHDPDHLVTATVDGEGVVTRIRFASTADTRSPETLERAVLAAVAAAQQGLEDAWRQIASRLDARQPVPTEDSAIDGGIELAFDPATLSALVDGGETRG